MEQNLQNNVTKTLAVQQESCAFCHQPLLPQYYFCPNCGKQIHQPPLPTGIGAQLSLYALSIILPSLCFLFIRNWKGIEYLKEKNGTSKIIGTIACTLLLLSTVLTFWYAYKVTQDIVQKAMKSTEANMNDF